MEQEKKKRKVLRSILTKKVNEIEVLKKKKDRPTSILEFSALLDQLQDIGSQVNASNEKVQEIMIDDKEVTEEILTEEFSNSQEYKDKLIFGVNQLRFLIEKSSAQANDDSVGLSETLYSNCVKLPTLNLPFFDGSILEYQPFMDSFQAAVGNRSISDVEKFNYLKNQLRGDASKSIQGLSLTSANYNEAIEILQKRYGRPSVIIRAHVKNLLALERISKLNPQELRKIVDQIEINVRGLKTLGVTSDSYGIFLIQIVLSKLPTSLCLEWARSSDVEDAEIDDLLSFLENEIRSHEIVNEPISTLSTAEDRIPKTKRYETAHVLQSGQRFCALCNQSSHFLTNCSKFQALSLDERNTEVKRLKLCFNCLKKHQVKDCTSASRCKKCHRKHHTHLHREKDTSSESRETTVTTINNRNTDRHGILLQTATCYVNGRRGRQCVRVLLDGGSELSYVRKDLLKSVNYVEVCERELNLVGFGERSSGQRRYDEVSIKLFDRHSDRSIEVSTIVVDKLCSPVNGQVSAADIREFANLQGLQLADSFDNPDRPIDILIGANFLYDILMDNRLRSKDGPTAEQSIFGWILHGPLQSTSQRASPTGTQINFCVCDDMLQSFWQNDSLELPQNEKLLDYDDLAMKRFNESIERTEDSRYQVGWPWIDKENLEMDDSRDVAQTRLTSLTKRLKRDKDLLKRYQAVIDGYLQDGIVEKVEPEEEDSANHVRYLPHHCVVKEDRATTKVRIVFDAAAKDKHGIALNDLLMAGPNLNPDLFGVLIRFRLNPIAVTADIKQAFLQIGLKDREKDVVRFLWYDDEITEDWPTQAPCTYRMKRVVFGVRSSPFLLAVTIRHHLNNRQFENPAFHQLLSNNLYVDDLVVSLETIKDAMDLRQEASKACNEMQMELRKWETNDVDLANELEIKRESSETSVLGLVWNPVEDKIRCNITAAEDTTPTKRQILRSVATIFDPLGILSPITVIVKQLLQRIWKLRLQWDENLPADIVTIWKRWIQERNLMKEFWLDRYIHSTYEHDVELHVFADASQTAYAAVIYLKSIDRNGGVHVSFLIARTKIAPLKGETIPRLELMACLLAAKLLQMVLHNIGVSLEYYCWTDSQVALSWIRSEPHVWKPYVKNRVSQIQSLTDKSRWKHVKGGENPADVPSRGMLPSKLKNCNLWWGGPSFLQSNVSVPEITTENEEEISSLTVKELKKQTLSHTLVNPEPVIPWKKFSSLGKLIRVTCLVRRFISNCRSIENDRLNGPLNEAELKRSNDYWIKYSQQCDFNDEIESLKAERPIAKNSRLSHLNPMLDEDGILRSGGRLVNSRLESLTKFPIILPSDSNFTQLVIKNRHEELVHAGVTSVISSLRSEYWILRARKETKKVLRRCPRCNRQNSKPYSEETAPLPIERVDTEKPYPFLYIGVDFAGPLFVNNGSEQAKIYILLITCTRIRAVHLELTFNLSTVEFLDAFERFMARRGVPSTVFSDNAKTFKRAADILSSTRGVRWRFITERAPWHGGFWERLVQSVKVALRKSLGKSIVGFNQLRTLLCQIEGAINSRPITYVESDSQELEPLSPAKFLIGRNPSDNGFENSNLEENTKEELSDNWLERKRVFEHFWERWKCEYLPLLNNTHRRADGSKKIEVGDIVIIHVDDKGKHLWPLGRVAALYPSSDGKVRTVSLRSRGKLIRRPIQKLYFLESSCESIVNKESAKTIVSEDKENLSFGTVLNEDVTEDSTVKRTRTRTINPPVKYGW